jgi:UDP-N-acetyl-D-mannosaminuronate dehydrogenase
VRKEAKTVVVGLGEVGKPLFQLISKHHDTIGIDISPVEVSDAVDVLHICYPFQISDFVGETSSYVERFKPALTVINSTVAVGTTRAVARRTGAAVVNSPVRGKHARMLQELQMYTKFVGTMNVSWGEQAARHFQSVGLKTKVLSPPEASELAKLTETTYFGLIIAWAQEIERYCDRFGLNYDDLVSFYEEIRFFPPVKYFPGLIGGHCVMPNIEILRKLTHSQLLDAIQSSNAMKLERDARVKTAAQSPVATGPVAGQREYAGL